MNSILLIISILTSITIIWFILNPGRRSNVDNVQSNIEINKDKQIELNIDLKNKDIDLSSYKEASNDIINSLASELPKSDGVFTIVKPTTLTLILIPVFIYISLYYANNLFVTPIIPAPVDIVSNIKVKGNVFDINSEITQLKSYLKENPKDYISWSKLGLYLFETKEIEASIKAYHSSYLINKTDPNILIEYATAAIISGSIPMAMPIKLINSALAINPNNPKALFLKGILEINPKNISMSYKYWNLSKSLTLEGSPDMVLIDNLLNK